MTPPLDKSRILIVEDEEPIREMVRFILLNHGFIVDEAEDIKSAKNYVSSICPNLILLDWMLPGGSGIDFARSIRKDPITREIALIMLTARAEEEHRIKGFETGVDDYIVKPFSPRELVARIQAVLRRGPLASPEGYLYFKDMQIDSSKQRITIGGEAIPAGPTEYRLLKFFVSHQKRIYSREQIIYYIWGRDKYIEERTVDVHIRRLRKLLQVHTYDVYIRTVRSGGYMFAETAS